MNKIVMPLPASDFDPTEAGVTWRILKQHGIAVSFATPDGKVAAADPRMVEGSGLGPWRSFLQADNHGLSAYGEMSQDPAFRQPGRWDRVATPDYAAIVLPGGHAPGMRPYLESTSLQQTVAAFCAAGKIVGAICHGVVLAGRSRDAQGNSVLSGRRATALLQIQEIAAWALTCLWLKNYYRTYPETVQAEVTRHLGGQERFLVGPPALRRDSPKHLERGFVVEDGNLITARWPGDAHRFGTTLARRISG